MVLMPCDAISASTLPASALIAAVEAAREAQPPVLFYLYDAPVIPTSVGAELAKLERCGTPEKLYHYGGSYWFLRQLLNHSWRVHSPEEASLLVVPALHDYQTARGPGGGGRLQFCKGLTPTEKIVRAINRTTAWRERLRDHLFVSLDWEHGRLPGSVKGSALLRGFVETRWSTPMTKGFQTRALSGHTTDFLLTVPYVDNGASFPHTTLATQWTLEARRAFAPLPAPGAPPITRQAIRTRRNVTFYQLQSQALYPVLQHYTGEKITSISVLGDHNLIFNTFLGDNGFVNQNTRGDWEITIEGKVVYTIEKDVFEVLVKPSRKSSLENYVGILNDLFTDKKISDRSRILVFNILLFLEEYIINSDFLPKRNLRVGPFSIFNYKGNKFVYCLN